MSDRSNFYYAQMVTEAEMDQAFDDLENADKHQVDDLDVWGVLNGLGVSPDSPPSMSVFVASGVAYDASGTRIPGPSSPEGIDLTGYVPTTANRWVNITIQSGTINSDSRVDGTGATIYYRQTESYAIGITAGSEGGLPPTPGGNEVLLARVLMYPGMISVAASDVYNGVEDGDRQTGTVIRTGRTLDKSELAGSEVVLFGSDVSIKGAGLIQGASATPGTSRIDSNGGDVETNGGDFNAGSGRVILASSVNAESPDPANDKGHLYTDTLGALVDIDKYFSVDASEMFPGQTLNHPWQAPTANVWTLFEEGIFALPAVVGALGWEMDFGSGAEAASYGLYIPIHLPDGAKLITAQVGYKVVVAPVADHYLRMWLLRRSASGLLVDCIGPNPPTLEHQAVKGDYTWSETYNSGVSQIVDNQNYRYYLAVDHYTAAGITSENTFRIAAATIHYQIREASGVY